MVQIVKEHRKKSTSEQFGNAFSNAGQSLGQSLYNKEIERESEQKNLKLLTEENAAIKRETGIDLSGIRDPNARQQFLADALKRGGAQKQAEASGKVDYAVGDQPSMRTPRESREDMQQFLEENSPKPRAQFPEFGGGEKRISPKGKTGKTETGNMPQPETKGQKMPVLDPNQINQEGSRIAQESRAQGIPMTDQEGMQIADQQNQRIMQYNQSVEADQQQKVNAQIKYGQRAVEKIERVLPDASDEIKAIFQKKGEEAAKVYDSEADTDRYLSKEANKFKNDIANVKKNLPSPTVFTQTMDRLQGNERAQEKKINDIRIKLDPLLKDGLFDTAREILSENGYSPEDRESIISNLGEGAKKTLAQLPDFKSKTTKPGLFAAGKIDRKAGKIVPAGMKIKDGEVVPGGLDEEDYGTVRDNLSSVLKADPSTNLILLRKAYQDQKGVDWMDFKDVINELLSKSPQEGGITLNEDQFNQLNSTLDEPPISPLGRILKFLHLE